VIVQGNGEKCPFFRLMHVTIWRDGRPAEYRWCAIAVQRRKVWLMPATLPRRETRWNYLGCSKLTKRSQLLLSRSSPNCEDMWRRYWCLTIFFPIVDMCLSCEYTPDKVVRWCPDGEFLAIFWVLHFQRAACGISQTLFFSKQMTKGDLRH